MSFKAEITPKTSLVLNVNLKNVFITFLFFTVFAGQAYRNIIGWGLYAVLVVIIAIIAVFLFKPEITNQNLKNVPIPLVLFLIWCGATIFWSSYGWTVALGSIIQLVTAGVAFLVAINVSWELLAKTLTNALKWIIGLSFVFEYYVAIVIENRLNSLSKPLTPWSDGYIFIGGPIQGIVGNRNLIAFIALLLLILLFVQFKQKQLTKLNFFCWVVLCLMIFVLTGSATITLTFLILVVLTLCVYVIRKIVPSQHKIAYSVLSGLVILGVSGFIVFYSELFAFLGRDPTASGRFGIWRSVFHLVEQKPVTGWGWMGYWAPWVKPFNNLAIIEGTAYLQAHNAALDVLVQTGLVGLILALMVTIIGAVRVWRIAVAPIAVEGLKPFSAMTLLPLLLLAALFIQSLTESRLLTEGNFFLLVILLYKAKEFAPPYGSVRMLNKSKS